MIAIEETTKDVATAISDLTAAVIKKGYSVLHSFDLQATLQSKGIEFNNACHILDVCNPQHAASVLGHDMRLSLALPCRVCVYEDKGKTIIGTIRPAALIGVFSDDEVLREIAAQVEMDILGMVHDAV